MEILKISSKSNPNSVAGAIAGLVKENNYAEMQAIGAGALNQAVKAVAIARGFVAPAGVDLVCVPDGTEFINKLANSIEKVSPYGKHWPEPVIVSEFKVSNIRKFSGDQYRISVYIDRFFEIDFSYSGNIDFTIGDKIIVAYKINTKVIKREVKNTLDAILMKKINSIIKM